MRLAIPDLDEIRAEKARRHLAEFARQAWHVVEPNTKLIWNWHLDAICDHLEAVTDGRIQNLLINVPPGHMKSLLVSVFWPAWVWGPRRRPDWRAIFGSYADTLSLRDAVKMRTIIESEWYRETFAPTWTLADDQNAKGYFANTRTGFRISTTVGGAGTGHRGDCIVIDDPLNASEAFSKPARDQVIRWWKYTIANRLSNMRQGSRVIIMQRLHDEDLSGYLLKEEKGYWEHLCLPSKFERQRRSATSIGWADPREKEGELLFPEMFPDSVIAVEEKRLGSIGFPGQHQQRPTGAEGGMFKRDWWRFWRHSWEEPVLDLIGRTVVLPDTFDDWLQSWDCAFKGKEENDRVAGGVWAKKGADKFLLDLAWDQLTFTETLREFRSLSAKWPLARKKLIEDKANGPAIVDTLRHEIAGIIPVEPEGGKEARAAATSPEVEAGNIYLPLHVSWRDEYIKEHASFPRASHDDVVDQQSQALLRWSTKKPVTFGNVDFDRTAFQRRW